ncbi:site-specific integrase [Lacinutrix sp. C3R15]|uniref:site-specific integrase n=1 Tax=Flavobacteriaceae TaxID=49546 RepID=UPI001C08BF85|nr:MULTISPECIES: site-specific integrase [Flavobacteriaceae]MBU2939857.1 site-specific integrase [Lacinutrix sp. C3R15]MDO6623173.1 site-specific integrase [Oceanihabitans sp. 1_MG-2023]
MKYNKLSVLFLIDKTKINKQEKCPIKCRITYLKKRRVFSTGLFTVVDCWNSKKQKAIPLNKENENINTQMSLIKQRINQAFLLLQVNNESFDVEDIYLQYVGKNVKANKTLLEVFELHNNRMKKLIGVEYSKSTYNKFTEARNHVLHFIRFQYKKGDMLLESINQNFLDDFDFYLKSEKKQKQITINKSIQRVRKIIKLALAKGYLKKDPFILYKPKKYESKVVYLNQKELDKLENHTFRQARLNQVKDMFIFCCYTGLAYQEMSTLKEEHLIKGFDGGIWIEMMRQKTKSKVSIPLLPRASKILDKYRPEGRLLPVISNQKFNSYLKEIAELVEIDKRLTHHIARKTFATTVLLYNDIPIETVSELLGHSSISITQRHYAKVVQHKVSSQMSKLSKKLKKKG